MSEKQRNEAVREFLAKLPLLHSEAVRLGLFVTARAIHNAVKSSGWEAAGNIERAATYAPNFEAE